MKRSLLFFFFLVVTAGLIAQESQVKTGPIMHFEKDLLEFGTITQGDTVEHTFVFENIGTAPLRILSASGSCGCTVPKYAKDAIQPGDKGEVFVRFRSAGKRGQQNVTVNILTNASTNPRLKLTLRGMVKIKDTED